MANKKRKPNTGARPANQVAAVQKTETKSEISEEAVKASTTEADFEAKKVLLFEKLNDELSKLKTENKKTFTINRVGSMISVFFCENTVENYEDASKADTPDFKAFFHGLLEKGIYIAPSSYETWFITDALTYEDLDATIQAIAEVTK